MRKPHSCPSWGGGRVAIFLEESDVADPMLNHAMGIKINGVRSMFMYENVIDFDLSSLYPSIILALNIDVSTQYGKLYLWGRDNGEYVRQLGEEIGEDELVDISYRYMDSLASRDWLAVGNRWFDLPKPTEVFEELDKLLECA